MSKPRFVLRATILTAVVCLPAWPARGQVRRFEKVSPHCYFLPGGTGSPNVAAIVSEEGVLVVNPPAEPELSTVVEALKKINPKPIRWSVCTDRARVAAGGALALSRQGALLIASAGFRKAEVSPGKGEEKAATPTASPDPSLAFVRQSRIFADNLEIKLQAPESEWHTGGDVVIFIPAEKVLLVGDLFSPGSFPDFGHESGRPSALVWLEALKQVIDMVPLLKPAMPPPKPEPEKPEEEPKTLEELVIVLPAIGPPSNLQEMKDLLASGQKVRADVARTVAQKRNRETFIDLPMFGPYRGLMNLDSFATRLFDEIRGR
jgi:glyoxylase-like metal-dependent hydrolase (beta-lactamase superfamily II)